MLDKNDVLSTVQMIDRQHLDIRTITMGISLLSCADRDAKAACEKIYDKITRYAEGLVKTGEDIEREFGIPIVNKRISVTPIALVAAASETEDYVPFAVALDRAAKAVGVNFIGGFSALVHKGMTDADRRLIAAIPEALAVTDLVCSSVNVGSTKAGINMDAVALMGRTVKAAAERTADCGGFGCAKLVVFCNAVEDNFMAGAFHGVGEPERVINVGVSGPGVVYHALQSVKGQPFDVVAETVKKTAFRITRMGQLVAQEASRRLNTPFGIVDLSLAPTPAAAVRAKPSSTFLSIAVNRVNRPVSTTAHTREFTVYRKKCARISLYIRQESTKVRKWELLFSSMYTVRILFSSKGMAFSLNARSILVSYSNRSPATSTSSSTASRGSARRPVWVSEMVMPTKVLNTSDVVWLPNRLRFGTWSSVKSRQPRMQGPVSSIFSQHARVSSGWCWLSPSTVTTPAPSGQLSRNHRKAVFKAAPFPRFTS